MVSSQSRVRLTGSPGGEERGRVRAGRGSPGPLEERRGDGSEQGAAHRVPWRRGEGTGQSRVRLTGSPGEEERGRVRAGSDSPGPLEERRGGGSEQGPTHRVPWRRGEGTGQSRARLTGSPGEERRGDGSGTSTTNLANQHPAHRVPSPCSGAARTRERDTSLALLFEENRR